MSDVDIVVYFITHRQFYDHLTSTIFLKNNNLVIPSDLLNSLLIHVSHSLSEDSATYDEIIKMSKEVGHVEICTVFEKIPTNNYFTRLITLYALSKMLAIKHMENELDNLNAFYSLSILTSYLTSDAFANCITSNTTFKNILAKHNCNDKQTKLQTAGTIETIMDKNDPKHQSFFSLKNSFISAILVSVSYGLYIYVKKNK
jgi:hypothetical protein